MPSQRHFHPGIPGILMAKIFIPSIGVAMEEALLVSWLKQPGEEVAGEEAVAEIETDKAAMDLTSPVSGKWARTCSSRARSSRWAPRIAEVLEEARRVQLEPSQPEAPVVNTSRWPRRQLRLPGWDRWPPCAAQTQPAGASYDRERAAEVPAQAEASPQADRFRALIAAKVAESWREIPHFASLGRWIAESMLATLGILRRALPNRCRP